MALSPHSSSDCLLPPILFPNALTEKNYAIVTAQPGGSWITPQRLGQGNWCFYSSSGSPCCINFHILLAFVHHVVRRILRYNQAILAPQFHQINTSLSPSRNDDKGILPEEILRPENRWRGSAHLALWFLPTFSRNNKPNPLGRYLASTRTLGYSAALSKL
jgi:hypothetical protein